MQTVRKNLLNKSGIYCILNITNQKRYIGSSKSLSERLINHKCQLRKNKHNNKILQNSWNKYKENNFIYIILEFCEIENLIEKEQFYIDLFQPEFNIVKKVLEHSSFGKQIHQYDLNGNFIKSYDYIIKACKENNIHQSTICRFLNKTYKKGGNYLWSLNYVNKLEPYIKDKKDNTFLNKKVNIINYNSLQLEMSFNSLKECANYFNCFPSQISQSIKRKSKFKNKYYIEIATLDGDI
jgi:group I intron endonuclease